MPGIMVAAGEGGREKVAGAAWAVGDMSVEKKKTYNKREKKTKGETGEEDRPTSRGGKTSGYEVQRERERGEEGTSAEMFQQKVSC